MENLRNDEYLCGCGKIGKKSPHEIKLLRSLLGKLTKNPPICLKCNKQICPSCRRGNFCPECVIRGSSGSLVFYYFFTILMWISLLFGIGSILLIIINIVLFDLDKILDSLILFLGFTVSYIILRIVSNSVLSTMRDLSDYYAMIKGK